MISKPDNGIFHRNNLIRDSVIDLVFSTHELSQYISWWKDSEYTVGSEHDMIFFSIARESALVENPIYTCQYNFDKADWKKLNESILSEQDNKEFRWSLTELSEESLELEVLKLQKLIIKLIELYIPKKKYSERSKPWWSDKLKELRKEMTKYRRKWKRHAEINAEQKYHIARATYYYEIKTAKSNCWNNFLENAQGKDIFKAFQYTKQARIEKLPILQYQLENQEIKAITFHEKCNAFMETLFTKPPDSEEPNWSSYQESKQWNWPEVSKDEIKAAIFTSSIKKAAGPDTISFLIIQKIYTVLEDRLYKLYSTLIKTDYHPKCWKEAVGIILKKQNRKATIPKSYRVISLLNCLGKIAEKIIASRLAYLAEIPEVNLLDSDQIGGRKQKSAIDAVLSLVHDIQLAKHEKKVTSVLFMDIKGAFDHVSANQLLKICQQLELPKSLCYWIKSFMQDRKIQLKFDGNSQEMTDINIRIPQDSPVSPILFLIYIRFLFNKRINTSERILSYLDDIGLAVSSNSIEENCQLLQKLAKDLLIKQDQNCMQFDMEKTELIHFHSKRFLDLKSELYSIKLNVIRIQPKNLVKWLGIWLDSKLSFKDHVEKKIAQALRTFNQIERLSNTERGLSFQAMRQLYIACISSVADYGVPVWWNNQKTILEKFQKLQNLALRKILGAFKSSPASAMEIEASLSSPKVRFNKICKNYALRILQMHENHPIR